MMRLLRVLAAVTLVALSSVPVADSTGFGINAHIPSNAVADRIDAAGIEWVRIDFLWLLVEPERDVYEWSVYDALIDRLESRGLRIYAGLGATPTWATSGSEFSGVPDDPDDWREFCYLAALRYAGRVHAWGLWNEPNLDRFWEGNRPQYIDVILLPGARAISLADPSALLCAPDLAHLSSANWDDWLEATIRAAADQLDVITHHIYPSDGFAFEVTYDLETGGPFPFSPPSVMEVLQDADWWRRPFWLTETGVESHRWGEVRQANFVRNLLGAWFSPVRGSRSWVDRFFFYEMNDSPSPSVYTFGLLYGPPELVPKEAYIVYGETIADAIVDDAELVNSDIPGFFHPGVPVKSTITLRNAGTTSWSTEAMTLLVADTASTGWIVQTDQLTPGESVEPGASHEFVLTITAPMVPSMQVSSSTLLSVRMEREDSWPFGELLRQEVVVSDQPPPAITVQPVSKVVVPGTWVSLNVGASGASPLAYRWLRNGIELNDDDLFSGTDTATLVVRALSHEVAAFYQCEVANEVGRVVSLAASVSVGQPAPRRGGDRVVPSQSPSRIPPGIEDLRFSGPPNQP